MSPRVVPCAASALLAGLVDSPDPAALVEVARTSVSVHYETGRPDVPVLCVVTRAAVRLPNSVVAPVVPGPGPLTVRDGVLESSDQWFRVRRWWQPPRPRGLARPAKAPSLAGVHPIVRLRPDALVGAGPGLTPSGDDVLAGALVTAFAVSDPRLPRWRAETRAALLTRRTTAVSRGLLLHALDGWAIPELASFVVAACAGDLGAAGDRLLAVGHSSGAALAAGVLHVLGAEPAITNLEGAA